MNPRLDRRRDSSPQETENNFGPDRDGIVLVVAVWARLVTLMDRDHDSPARESEDRTVGSVTDHRIYAPERVGCEAGAYQIELVLREKYLGHFRDSEAEH